MFKAGDKVRVLRHRNFFGQDIPGYGIEPGTIVTLREPESDLNSDQFVVFAVEDIGDGWSWLVRSDDIEPVTEGPVRTVTRREIVPGRYGIVLVGTENCRREDAVSIVINADANAEELRETAHLFNQLAEALDDAG